MNVTGWPAWCRPVRVSPHGLEVTCRRCWASFCLTVANHDLASCPCCGRGEAWGERSESADARDFCGY